MTRSGAFGEVVIVDGVRTPFAPHDTIPSNRHAVDLLAAAFTGLFERSSVSPGDIDHIIVGCAVPVGEQAMNVARNAALAAGWSESTPAHTVDAQAASGVCALHEAVARIRSGMAGACVVAAVSSTRVPDGASTGVAVGKPFGPAVHARYEEAGGLRSPGLTAEHLALEYGLDRATLDAYADRLLGLSQDETTDLKRFVVPVSDGKRIPTIVDADTDVVARRHLTSGELKPLFENDGILTAATVAQPVSCAVAMIVTSQTALARKELPLARILAAASAGAGVLRGSSGIDVAKSALASAGAKGFDGVDVIEVMEDTAVTPLAFARDAVVRLESINRRGGALGHGDAFGASGLACVLHTAHGLNHEAGTGLGLSVTAGSAGLVTATVLARPSTI